MFAGYRHCKKCGKALMGLFDGAFCDDCEKEESRRMKDKDYEQLATKIMINALEGVKAQIRKSYDKGYKDGKADTPFTDTEEAEKKAYNRGLDEAWKAAKKIIKYAVDGGYSPDVLREIFGESIIQLIFEHNTALEALTKIKEYEKQQKQNAEIEIGDEVVYNTFNDRGIIISISPNKHYITIICNNLTIMTVSKMDLHKTNKHYPQIAEALAELRGAEAVVVGKILAEGD